MEAFHAGYKFLAFFIERFRIYFLLRDTIYIQFEDIRTESYRVS